MNDWIDVVKLDEFKLHTWRLIPLEDTTLLVVNLPQGVFAIEDICTHDGGTLSDGDLEGCEMICPRHGARFDVTSGQVTAPPAYESVKTFPVQIENGMVQVRDDRFD
ncbi:MAG: non-heme iron oxygenase ferredoxin subunit [Pseudomonadota bacterium]